MRPPHAFPFLFAMLTVTALVASNPYEGIRLHNVTSPILLALCITLLAWALTALVIHDRLRRSLTASAVVLPLLISGYLLAWLRRSSLSNTVAAGLEAGCIVLTILAGILLIRHVRWAKGTARFLNLFGLLSLLICSPAMLGLLTGAEPHVGSPTLLPDASEVSRPDIYFIVLDAYTGAESQNRNYEFDNTPFLDSLRAIGFAIPERQRSNYMRTFLSLASILNRDYLDSLIAHAAPQYRDVGPAYHRMEFNRTTYDLKRLGYSFYYVGSSYAPLASNRLADDQYEVRHSREFERFWLRTTVLAPLLRLYCSIFNACRVPELAESAAETESRLAFLKSLVDRPGPKFVYAHLLLPHGPYRFDRDCMPRASRWTVGPRAIESDSLARRLYREQVECTNDKILELIDSIYAAASERPIVILQADHGAGRFPGDHPPNLAKAQPDQIEERFDVFAAYSGPNGLGDSLAQHRTPVNVFRTVFRVIWGVAEPPLEDKIYWSESDRPLLLQEVEREFDRF